MKNNYNEHFIKRLAESAAQLVPDFAEAAFTQKANSGLSDLEMKARIKQIGEAFYDGFNRDFKGVHQFGVKLFSVPASEVKSVWQSGIIYDPMAYIIEQYGHDHFEESMFLIGEITKRYTSEFAIRNLMFSRAKETIEVLEKWALEENEHLRRLASEGSRTRLPWGRKLHNLIAEPRLTRQILESLKTDPSKYVQKSVANHLNDISKDHEGYFYEIVEDWSKDKHPVTNWIIKHALRNEIKKGHPKALNLLGFKPAKIEVRAFDIHPKKIKLGEYLGLTATIVNKESKPADAVVDFGIHLVKANGSTFFKVFKWKNIRLEPGVNIEITKKYLIQKVTTRVYYPGIHQVDLLINGKTMATSSFELKM